MGRSRRSTRWYRRCGAFSYTVLLPTFTSGVQAVGAGAKKQVGVLLQLTLFYSVILLGLPTAISWTYMGAACSIRISFSLSMDGCATYRAANNCDIVLDIYGLYLMVCMVIQVLPWTGRA